MYLCYLDESGTPEPAGTSHFVLLGLSLPASSWKQRDSEVSAIKKRHRLETAEIHTAYMARMYPEQQRIAGFEQLDDRARRAAVHRERKADLGKAALRGNKAVQTLARTYKATDAYVHLTLAERRSALLKLASALGAWDEAVLFADAQAKVAHAGTAQRLFAFAFEQVVTRFHHYLTTKPPDAVGVLVQDNNQTAASHLTGLMRQFHSQGTTWAKIDRIVETPLFVDSQLTSMVQLADLCSFALRRFLENHETDLFERIYPRFDRFNGRLVGLRHFTGSAPCACKVCLDHGR